MPEHIEILRNRSGAPSPETLRRHGPIIEVEIRLPRFEHRMLEQTGQVPPSALAGPALIDTGAWKTGISSGVAEALGLPLLGRAPALTAAGLVQDRPIHRADLHLVPIDQLFSLLEVIAIDLQGYETAAGRPFIAALGRDLLQSAAFNYDVAAATWSLRFPD